MTYPLAGQHSDGVQPSPNLPQLEESVLEYWRTDKTFLASIAQRPAGENGANEFVFYDGPPFANGLPHYGHLLTGYAKDVVGRYKTQAGFHVERRFGWDTHGLPAELEAERILGIVDKSQIEEIGIAKFNETCRESVLRYTDEWETYVTRQARWVDFENDYKTLNLSFMESVIWAFKQLYDKGLAYEGYRVLPYCWHDETPLSNHELRMDDDVYQSRQDPALTVGLRLTAPTTASPIESGDLALIWTTTPWTLPANLAIAVGPEMEYSIVAPGSESALAGERVIIASGRIAAYAKELGSLAPGTDGDTADADPTHARVLATISGAELAGLRYAPIFPYFAGHDDAFQVVAADFVGADDGTGIVHLAPAFGEDDKAVCDAAGITPVVTVDAKGRMTPEVVDYQGEHVFEANKPIIADLKAGTGPLARVEPAQRAALVRHETYEHSYPHCWRCRNPLIYKAVSSWFVAVTTFRDRMVELNQEIDWVPGHIKDGSFGKWLAGARDWSISRNRYWGTPIPVWTSDNPEFPRTDVYGSLDEIEADFGVRPTDLHRPYIDELTRPNPDDPSGASTMRRIPDVLDVWFDSGSMPFAQVHYPFENQDWFEHHYPGDFIVEYIGQTRGWFYLLHVLATAIFDKPSFRTAVSHGIVLGDDGRKMSKSLRNYPDVQEVFNRDGSDAMRWFLMSSPILRGGNLVVTEGGIRDSVRQVLLPLWNTWYFFSLYANACNGGAGYSARKVEQTAASSLDVMDRYLLARTRNLVEVTTAQLDAYDIAGACETIREHLDILTNWYVRRSRDRFWNEDEGAFNTLYTALEILTRVMAPLAPLMTEEIWRGLTGGRSIHLSDFPTVADGGAEDAILVQDDALVAAMDRVRAVCSTALGLRKVNSLRVRQPVAELTIVLPDAERAALEPFAELIRDEVNVKNLQWFSDTDDAATSYGVVQRLSVNARAAGPRLGKQVQSVIASARNGDWFVAPDGAVVVGDVVMVEGEYSLETVVGAELGEDRAAAVLNGGGFVVLDLALSDELIAEGYANDLVRLIQDERKNAGLDVSDRISTSVLVPREWHSAVEAHQERIAAETLSVAFEIDDSLDETLAARVAKVQS